MNFFKAHLIQLMVLKLDQYQLVPLFLTTFIFYFIALFTLKHSTGIKNEDSQFFLKNILFDQEV